MLSENREEMMMGKIGDWPEEMSRFVLHYCCGGDWGQVTVHGEYFTVLE